MTAPRVLVTGAAGFVGARTLARLAAVDSIEAVIGIDVQEAPAGSTTYPMDVRAPELIDLVKSERINQVVHLAAVVNPRPEHTREFLHSVDVEGTANVVRACVEGGVSHLTVTSSGAAYGYHPDNPEWIDEQDPLRGNPEFAYSDHKRQVEETLASARRRHPEVAQLVLRPGTILGPGLSNQITRLFTAPVVLGISGAATPFVFIWIDDVVEIIAQGVLERRQGTYNLAGSGAVTMREIAREMSKPYLPLPAAMVRAGLALLKQLGLVAHGPEQVVFLAHRPVLSNRRLVEELGYTPRWSSLEAFRAWRDGL